MKRLFTLIVILFVGQSLIFAQKEKAVKEADVPARFVKDFQNQAKDAQNISWSMALDSSAYMASYTDNEGNAMAMRFTQKSTETRYYIEPQYYPHAIKDSVHNLYPSHKISCVYARSLRNKMSYQARIVRMKGILWWKKETDVKILSFETDGKMIEVVDEL
ncbi:MAG: hypothetical protein J6X88_02060 [Bacteroidales bacterium]|nr:hypothetical protein [Bacteroidales bacterium]